MTQSLIAHYSPTWPEQFEKEADLIKEALGDLLVAIEHIGSTAVPNLSAKPIIDIAVLTQSIADPTLFTTALEKIGYTYKPELSSPERLFLRKGSPVAFHLSLTEAKFGYWKRQILFRDYLRNHPEAVTEYEQIKKDAVAGLPDQDLADLSLSPTYNDKKSPFIKKIILLAEHGTKKTVHVTKKVTRIVWEIIGIITIIFGLITGYGFFTPRLALSQPKILDQRDPFLSTFILKNDGQFSIYDIGTEVHVLEATDTTGQSWEMKLPNQSMFSHVDDAAELEANADTTIVLGLNPTFEIPAGQLKSALIEIDVHCTTSFPYKAVTKPSGLNYRKITRVNILGYHRMSRRYGKI